RVVDRRVLARRGRWGREAPARREGRVAACRVGCVVGRVRRRVAWYGAEGVRRRGLSRRDGVGGPWEAVGGWRRCVELLQQLGVQIARLSDPRPRPRARLPPPD